MINLCKMNKIFEVDYENLILIVELGVLLMIIG